MISASHNPVEDNGIKFFGGDGFKLLDETELEIEQLLDAAVDELPRPLAAKLARLSDDQHAKFAYLEFLKATVEVFCRHTKSFWIARMAAAYELAPTCFPRAGC